MLGRRGLNVTAVLTKSDGSKEIHRTHNIITSAGDLYYAKRAAGESPAVAFDALHLGDGDTAPSKADDADALTPIAGAAASVTSGYPRTADPDADNTGSGADVVTWRFSFPSAAGPWADIAEGGIAAGSGALSSAEPLLTRFLFDAPFTKDSGESLVVFVNHSPNGV